jgi:hypothetical protein
MTTCGGVILQEIHGKGKTGGGKRKKQKRRRNKKKRA